MSDWWDRIRTLEPARLRAVWAAIIAVAVALGVTISADTDRAVQAAIVLFAALVPLVQGEATRRKVTPVAKLERDRALRPAPEAVDADDTDMIDVGGDTIVMHNYGSEGGE